MNLNKKLFNFLANYLLLKYLFFNGHVGASELEDQCEMIKENGYLCEEHETITEDGYYIKMFRVKNLKNFQNGSNPVLMTHGLGGSSGYFVDCYDNPSLAHILADDGYDVWLLNYRGNGYSKRHVSLDRSKDPKAFYNFSLHELGTLDNPASINYILNVTGHDSLFYIGHSQGGTAFFIMGSTYPEFTNRTVKLGITMAGTAIMKHVPALFINLPSKYINFLEILVKFIHLYHLPLLNPIRGFLKIFCRLPIFSDICVHFISLFSGIKDNSKQFNQKCFDGIFKTLPADISILQAIHYGKNIKHKRFQQFDYGKKGNLRQYGSEEPPIYDLKKIISPVSMYGSDNDIIQSAEDFLDIASLLPNLVHEKLIRNKKFNHIDYLWSKNAKKIVYEDMRELMKKYDNLNGAN